MTPQIKCCTIINDMVLEGILYEKNKRVIIHHRWVRQKTAFNKKKTKHQNYIDSRPYIRDFE